MERVHKETQTKKNMLIHRKMSNGDSAQAQPPDSHNKREAKEKKTGAIFIEKLLLFLMMLWDRGDETHDRKKHLVQGKAKEDRHMSRRREWQLRKTFKVKAPGGCC